MITTITLNPAIDCLYMIDDLEVGNLFRCSEYYKTAGGKGINVSKVLKEVGQDIQATGFFGGSNGYFISDELNKLHIKNEFVKINGNTRTCIAVLGENTSQTEILESGPIISEKEKKHFLEKYDNILKTSKMICASGSLPRGIDSNFYRILAEKAYEKKVKFILDTSGKALQEGIKGKPFLIKPNQEELEALFNIKMKNETQIVECAVKLCDIGVQNILISLGSSGSILVNENEVYKAVVPKIDVVNPVGSGDSMVAGFATAIHEGKELSYALKYASACGTANALEKETGKVREETISELLEQINIIKVQKI